MLALTKISILCFYLRVFPNRWFRVTAWLVMAWVGISGIIFVFMEIFQCNPVAYTWQGWRGDFGPHTAAAVQGVQTEAGIGVDGVVGLQTWAVPVHAAGQVIADLCGVTPPG